MQIADIRRLTPATENYAYFQTSGFSPKPEPVIEEVVRLTRFCSQGPALPGVYSKMQEVLEATRAKVAQSLNAAADEIVLSENATIGINIVANGIDWQPGDNLILSTHEHPGNRIPWYNLIRRYGVQLRFLNVYEDDERMLGELAGLIDSRTRLLSLSHVSRRTGLRFPAQAITALAQRHGVPVLWDGAQSYGAIPVDVKALNCDFYTFSGHKYIMAPQGTGGCYMRRDRIAWVNPSWIGSHSQKDFDLVGGLTLLDEAKRFEFGTRNLADQGGFGKALDLWQAIGWHNVFAAIEAYTDRMKAALLAVPGVILETPLPYAKSAGIVTISVPGFTSAGLYTSLLEHERILVSPLEHDTSMIRISTHVFNTDEEIERLVNGLRRIQNSGD
ncbi:MAG: aminotransferase class V-fold PLP-dependent enzyme [Caldilinea sp. CFX5]|nr:aminotransferase class V-fold PLP-dependent enzyme [Caldilinea sp. CFX5]